MSTMPVFKSNLCTPLLNIDFTKLEQRCADCSISIDHNNAHENDSFIHLSIQPHSRPSQNVIMQNSNV